MPAADAATPGVPLGAAEGGAPAAASPVGQPATGRMAVMGGLMLTMGLAAMDNTIVATAIPSIVRDLGGFARFPWLFSVYLLMQAATIPIYSKLADLYGRKPVLMAGAGIFLLGSALSGVSWNMMALIAFRGLQGIGAGALVPVATTVVGDLFDLKERARMQGYIASVWGIAAIVGPAVGGLLVQYASWHWIFFINLPLGVVALAVVGARLHENIQPRAHRIDYAGSVLLAFGMGAVILALLEGGTAWPWASWRTVATLALAAALLLAFVAVERRAAEPVVPTWVLRDRMLAGASVSSLIVGTMTIGLSSFLPTFMQGSLGATPLVAGFVLAAMSIGWPLASAASGRLYLRIGFRDTALVGAALTAGAALAFAALTMAAAPWHVGVIAFVMGAGFGLGSTAATVGAQQVVPWNRRGVATGAVMFGRMLGSTLGAAVYGAIVNADLTRWFRKAPPAVAAHLPSLNAATLGFGGAVAPVDPRVAGYVRRGIYFGVHHVFVALIVAAVVAAAAELWMPRRVGETDGAGSAGRPEEGRPAAEVAGQHL